MERLEVTEYHPEGLDLLTVRGELDLSTVPHLCLRMSNLRHRGRRPHAVIDLTELNFCDSTGLRGLLGEAREAEICGGEIRFVVPEDGIVRRLFDVCGVDQILTVDPDRATALRSMMVPVAA